MDYKAVARYPYICSEASAYKTVEDAESAEDCYTKCQEDAGECNHWTFHKLHRRTTCSFLLDCDQKDENCPNYPEDDTYCGSGPPNCDEKKYPCDPLKYATDNSRLQVRWQCSEESFPYQNEIPVGSICYAE